MLATTNSEPELALKVLCFKMFQYTNLYNVDVVDQEQQSKIHEHPVVHSQLDVLHLSRQDEEVGRECR